MTLDHVSEYVEYQADSLLDHSRSLIRIFNIGDCFEFMPFLLVNFIPSIYGGPILSHADQEDMDIKIA